MIMCLAEDALEGRADARQGGPRALVESVGLELDAVRPQRLEGVGQLEELRLAVGAGPLERRCRPRSSRSRGACARARWTCSGCCRSRGPRRGRWSRTVAPSRPRRWPGRSPASGAGPLPSRPARDPPIVQVPRHERLEIELSSPGAPRLYGMSGPRAASSVPRSRQMTPRRSLVTSGQGSRTLGYDSCTSANQTVGWPTGW